MNTIEGHLSAQGLRFAIVASRWNDFIGSRLVEGAVDCIVRHGGDPNHISLYRCPGSFELPMVVRKVALAKQYDAVIAIGVLIRGATPHFELIAAETTKGIAQAAIDAGIPVTFGVLTTDTIEQAIERAGTKAGNKGWEAAAAAIEMANLYRHLQD
ncbi:MAG: 6,7-dimethyl-8-ribityllumazine synthase [Chloroherpetonaceae bacterium]|nr:6,7-dimethyl-8-ribityllumazine synthase [Chloroherpetonaceae bacterium]MCS7210616.1 6,7-dimethyl-8-ribityllumazine synthase [Chloroherpetonaceae bacterium]MDW8020474.1 6,7-dimethyl-8-ribityllumazine synthase [Chloroherpetonaceae bacterium]